VNPKLLLPFVVLGLVRNVRAEVTDDAEQGSALIRMMAEPSDSLRNELVGVAGDGIQHDPRWYPLMIEGLHHEQTWERAERKLLPRGKQALSILKDAAYDPDPIRAARIDALVTKIQQQ